VVSRPLLPVHDGPRIDSPETVFNPGPVDLAVSLHDQALLTLAGILIEQAWR
jgi:hypothetical protein